MLLLAGTSGFSYTEWRGSFYDEGLPEARMLEAYSQKLETVEINNTFYRMPQASVLAGWAQRTPGTFAFALKAPRRITHSAKLKDTEEAVATLFQLAENLGTKLGPVLFQLPPFLRKDSALLAAFCASLPKSARVALEFRHESWFCDEVYAVLAAANVALCACEVDPDEGSGAPFIRTAPFTYVRLRRALYDSAALDAALARITGLGVEQAFVYFKHEVLGPKYALELRARSR
jgi:uncharacterized protein YecE (DUF72 family)